MKHRFFTKIIALLLSVSLMAGLSLSSMATIGSHADDGNGGDSGGSGTFAAGEVLAPADSLQHAQQIAAAYRLELISYAYGIAVMAAADPEMAVERSQLPSIATAGMPRLSLNRVYQIYSSGDGDRCSDRSRAYNPSAYETMDSPDSGVQWHHEEMNTESAWAYSTGAGVVIAVIDTGIDIDHPAFAGRISELSYNSQSDEIGRQYVRDDHGHGTHVSGIAAAYAPEADVYGVAYEAVIMKIKANEPGEGAFYTVSLLRGINYAVENGADIINMSLGSHYAGGPNELEHDTIRAAVASGVTIIAAAGNDSFYHAGYPAAYPEVVAVSATKQGYAFDDSYSNFGPEISVAAPGSLIYAPVRGGGYSDLSGTSMASPNVTGIAALIKAAFPGYSVQQLRDTLCGTAQDVGDPGWDEYYGYGIVDADAAVQGMEFLYHSVTYDYNDGEREPVVVSVLDGNRLFEPTAPSLDGYAFLGWYDSPTGGQIHNFRSPIRADMTLYAQWAEVLPGMYYAEFPDPNFRSWVLGLINGKDDGDRTAGSMVTDEDEVLLASFDTLHVGGLGIYDLTGVQYFTGITHLCCFENMLTELDVSKNTKLKGDAVFSEAGIYITPQSAYFSGEWGLLCDRNQITSLDLSQNKELVSAYVSENPLTELDISENHDLELLWCFINGLTELDISQNANLKMLVCWANGLEEIVTSAANTNMEILGADNNSLTRIDLPYSQGMKMLSFTNNQVAELNVPLGPELIALWLEGGNQIRSLDLSASRALQYLDSSGVWQISDSEFGRRELRLTEYPELIEFEIGGNRLIGADGELLSEIDFSASTKLKLLGVGSTQLTVLDVSNNPALEWLSCGDNQLNELVVTQNPMLKNLFCNANQLTELDLSQNPALEMLEINYNLLTEIDLSHNPVLSRLLSNHSKLTGLDTSGNPALRELWCIGNELAFLDVSGSPLLSSLVVEDNSLATLDVSGNQELTLLSVNGNLLTSLDVSQNPALTWLNVANNYFPDKSAIIGLDETRTTLYFDPQRSAADSVLLGDVNEDGAINILDVNRLYLHVRGRLTLTGDQLLAADVNKDGNVNILDVNRLYLYIRGRLASL